MLRWAPGLLDPAATVTVGRIIWLPLLAKKNGITPALCSVRCPLPSTAGGHSPYAPWRDPTEQVAQAFTMLMLHTIFLLSLFFTSEPIQLIPPSVPQVKPSATSCICLMQLFTHALPCMFPPTNQANPCQPHSLCPHHTCHSIFFYPPPGIHSHCKFHCSINYSHCKLFHCYINYSHFKLFQHSHCKLFHCSNIRILYCFIIPTFAL